MTTIPAILLWLEAGLLYDWKTYYLDNLDLLLGILGYGLVLTVTLSLLVVATAVWVRRTVPMVMVWMGLFVFLRMLGAWLTEALKDERWRLIDLWNNLYLCGLSCLGAEHETVRPAPQPAYWRRVARRRRRLRRVFALPAPASSGRGNRAVEVRRTAQGRTAIWSERSDQPAVGRRASACASSLRSRLTPTRSPTSGEPLLLFEHVSKWYGTVLALNQVTLELTGGITGLVGANGAGKSHAAAAGERATEADARPRLGSRHRRLGLARPAARRLLPGRRCLLRRPVRPPVRVGHGPAVRLHREPKRRGAPKSVLERVGMSDRADRKLRGYSKGMRQRIKLAQALLHDPELLILDEPLSGIDPIGRQELLELFQALAAQGKCLLISSHELEALEKLTNHVAIMARGRVAAVGTLPQIRDLLDDHPLSVRIDVDRARDVARLLARRAGGAGRRCGREGRPTGARREGPQPEAILRGVRPARDRGATRSRAASNRSTNRPTPSSATCSAARDEREICDRRLIPCVRSTRVPHASQQ